MIENFSTSSDGFYKAAFNLCPKHTDDEFVYFQSPPTTVQNMSVDLDCKPWNPSEINGNHDEASWPGSSSTGIPSPSEVNEFTGSESFQDATTPEISTPQIVEDENGQVDSKAVSSDVEIETDNVDTNDDDLVETAKDNDDEMDCFSFNFSIKKSFFTSNKSTESAKHQEVLLMDKMMKQCFGYIILSRTNPTNTNGESTELNGIESHLKRNTVSPCESLSSGPDAESSNHPTPKPAEIMSDCVDSNVNGTAVSYCKTSELAKFQRNKRKRVRPQQRDDALAPSPVPEFAPAIGFDHSLPINLKQEFSGGFNHEVLNLSSAQESSNIVDSNTSDQNDSKEMIAMDLSIDTKSEKPKSDVIPKPDFKPVKKSMVSENTGACPLDLTQTFTPKDAHQFELTQPENFLAKTSLSCPTSVITTNQSAMAALQQQHVATLAAAAAATAGLFPQFPSPLGAHRSPPNSFLGATSCSSSTDPGFGSFLGSPSTTMARLFNDASANAFDYLEKFSAPPPKKANTQGSKMKDSDSSQGLSSFSTHQHQSRLPSVSNGSSSNGSRSGSKNSMQSSPSTSSKEMISCGVCGKRFKTWAYIKDHMRLHTGEKPFRCLHCPASFPNKSHLNYHVKSKHLVATGLETDPITGNPIPRIDTSGLTEAGLLKCELCFRQFNSKSALTLHSKRCGLKSEASKTTNSSNANGGSMISPPISTQMQFFNDCASVIPQAAPGGAVPPPATSATSETPRQMSINPSNLSSISSAIDAAIQSVTAGFSR